jgi:hypothetical protein
MWCLIGVLAVVALCALLAVTFGAALWRARTGRLLAALEASRVPPRPEPYAPEELAALPAPVQRYLQAVLPPDQPPIASVHIAHEGQLNTGKTVPKWAPFTSSQTVTTSRPGFLWDGAVRMAPGLTASVHDAYIAGEGLLQASLLGLVTMAEARGTPEIAQGELLRYLAETAWYPTALLPGQGVHWEAIDDTSARATLCDGDTSVSLTFDFGPSGLIDTVRTEGRYRDVNGTQVLTPWQGRFWAYEARGGISVPMEAEVSWMSPDSPWPYWRARITGINYDFAGE